jgi:hypothetical protein
LHTENQLYTLPGSALKVCVVVGGGGWWVLKANLVISFGFGQAEQYQIWCCLHDFHVPQTYGLGDIYIWPVCE